MECLNGGYGDEFPCECDNCELFREYHRYIKKLNESGREFLEEFFDAFIELKEENERLRMLVSETK